MSRVDIFFSYKSEMRLVCSGGIFVNLAYFSVTSSLQRKLDSDGEKLEGFIVNQLPKFQVFSTLGCIDMS